MMRFLLYIIAFLNFLSCSSQEPQRIITGAERTEQYFPQLQGKQIAICANQTSIIGKVYLLDSLLRAGIDDFQIMRVFSPEHGFRGDADDGMLINDSVDPETGIQVVSLYGRNRKPSAEVMEGLDLVIFDIQDVGIRFYTYISTLFYLMQTCAEQNIRLMVLDRPNPNGFYVDGPVLKEEHKSFIGLHPVPVVHGMTIGEYAQMINGEKWLGNGLVCDLTIITCNNYDHTMKYDLPVSPSPNLATMNGIYLYPSIGLFEGTVISEGRGTDNPFEVFGHPELQNAPFIFVPRSMPGKSTHPKQQGLTCYGFDLRGYSDGLDSMQLHLDLSWLLFAYNNITDQKSFFTDYFDLLAGDSLLRKQIIMGLSEEEIRESWEEEVDAFMEIRNKYLLYPDF
ncbi:MAG: DUF1343 domain-containing protein [Bacteroidales bacterium]|nr:DUF1343 domain-containing protein [Bacteroidales bacterium]